MKRILFASLTAATFAALSMQAQSPAPIVVQAAPPQPAAPVTPQAADQPAARAATLQTLQQIKAANDAVLAKQAATLEKLEELEKNVDQLKIYSKRG